MAGKKKELMKGNHALAEAAVRAGVEFYAGYPITPQSEILEYMSWRLPEAGGRFIQTESEISGISMVYGAAMMGARVITSSSGPGFDLMQEGIGYIAASRLPFVVIDVVRIGAGLGMTTAAQGDYLQLAKNGAHGDYKCIVLTPGSLQEAVDFIPLAYEITEKHYVPVIVAVDGSIAQMVEAVSFPDEITKHNRDKYDWAYKHKRGDGTRFRALESFFSDVPSDEWAERFTEKINTIREEEARWEEYDVEDADVILVAYGTTSRLCREAVIKARKNGMKLGLIRPQTIWPFPEKAFRKNLPAKGYLTVELCDMPQMAEDVVMSVRGKAPVYAYAAGKAYPSIARIIEKAQEVMDGKMKEV